MNLLYEHMIRAETMRRICRIWRQDGASLRENAALKNLAYELLTNERLTLRQIADRLVIEERVNSVEVISVPSGDGICVHKDWP